MEINFSFRKTGLTVNFNVQLTANPVSLLWFMGDGTEYNILYEDSESLKLEHEYEYSGFYPVRLEVTYEYPKNVGETLLTIKTKSIGVSSVENKPLDKSIDMLVLTFIPPNLQGIENHFPFIPDLIQKWQLFLMTLVEFNKELEYIESELDWPPLVNFLIAQLVAYDLILIASKKYLIGLGVIDDDQGNMLELKSVRTGPTESEWFQGSKTWSEVFKRDGVFHELSRQICMLAGRLRIPLYICRNLSHNTIVPSVNKKPIKKRIDPFEKGSL